MTQPASRLRRLGALLRQEKQELIELWRQSARTLPGARQLDVPALTDHMPALVDELAAAFERGEEAVVADLRAEGVPSAHGRERLHAGFDITEVVAEYNILRRCLQDVAERHGLGLDGEAGHIANRVLDESIGLAVRTFATERAVEMQEQREQHLAFVVHDLRTPLAAISLAANVLAVEGVSDAERARMLRSLQRNVKRLDALVERMLEEQSALLAAAKGRLEKRDFDLWPVVENLLNDLRPLARTAGTQLANEVPDELSVHADAALVARILQNLVSNAIKSTPNGVIVVGASGEPDGAVAISVRDTGAGIAAEDLAGLLTVRDLAASRKATGFGLAIVTQLVEAHGGRLTAESHPGAGSTFRFTLPPGPTPA